MRIADSLPIRDWRFDRALTVAEFMRRALYDPVDGYYARAAQRSGRAGDFFTSVDVGPLFGELLEIQIAEIFRILYDKSETAEVAENAKQENVGSANTANVAVPSFDLVEAGAGNGRLSADILGAARTRHPALYAATRLHLVETSPAARAAQRITLGDAADRLVTSDAALPDSFEGVLLANELFDAMPVHQVVMTAKGLREIYVESDGGRLSAVAADPSTPRLATYLDAVGVRLERGWRVEINLAAIDWIRDAARRLRRGFMILIDYGHEARELYSVTHSAGTLTAFHGHRSAGPEDAATPAWLRHPGEQDLTAHVDSTSLRAAAEGEGMTTIALLDQTYFLMGLLQGGIADRESPNPQSSIRNSQLKTLLMPGGLGSTMKVLILGKQVGRPRLQGCSFAVRMT